MRPHAIVGNASVQLPSLAFINMLPITYLFVPGDRSDRFAKAQASGADTVVIDLEDAVSPDHKAHARACTATALEQGTFRACLRINGADSQWFEDDLRLLQLPGVMTVMLPKAETLDSLAAVRAAVAASTSLIPIIESARGLAAAETLAGCTGVLRLAFGSVDFQHDLGIDGDGEELLFARSHLVFASRLADVEAPIDGVTLAVNDAEQARVDALRARRLGFGGKLCIHPAQLTPVRAAFQPDASSIDWAQGVLAIAASSGQGAAIHEGKLIDKPVIDRARAILARSAA